VESWEQIAASDGEYNSRRLWVSNCTWEDGKVVANFRQPFDLLSEIGASAARAAVAEATKSAKTEIWLGD
jgi:hypothetical protein